LHRINRTTRERFAIAQTMLEDAIVIEPDNLDLKLALATLQLRGIQMEWYGPAERPPMESGIRSLLEHALRARPNYIPVMDAYCRLLNTTSRYVDSLIACAKTLSFNPWNGLALYHLGLAQLHLGRLEDALATFDQAYRFDTPAVSRWTWTLGAGWACTLMGRSEDALPWLQRSLATTFASGRTHMLLAAAYQQLGRTDEAKAALAKGQELRPGSTARNVPRPRENSSPVFVAASERVMQLMIAAGLPEG
jgi:tetratricopeptide (TPR) repeat protein